MATAVGTTVLYKVNGVDGFVPAVITKGYTGSAGSYTQADSTAVGSLTAADLLVLGLAPVKLTQVVKDTAVTAGASAATALASTTVGKWVVYS